MDSQTLARAQEYLSSQPNVRAAYLFGSAAGNLDHAQSNVDVALVLPETLGQSPAFQVQMYLSFGRSCLHRWMAVPGFGRAEGIGHKGCIT
jgi:predicted nucleotidyltransferase